MSSPMSSAPLHEQSIVELQALMDAGELTATVLTRHSLERIAQFDDQGPHLNAVQALSPRVLEEAERLDDERRAQGPRSLLHGIPLLVKDNYETVGMPTTAGSVLFAGFAPPRDAYLVERLRAAGAVIVGKTTMHEFAYGITTVGSGFGATKNPYVLTRNPGGSSGGTGAAVAAGFAVAGMGSDTCGSIRIPAAQNNLVGLRGTQGLSSRRGIVPLSSTQDIGGPLARSIGDLSILLDATVGEDPQDPQTAVMGVRPTASYKDALRRISGAKIGVLVDWLRVEDEDEAVAAVVEAQLATMKEIADWRLVELESPALSAALDRPVGGHLVLVTDFKYDIEAYLSANPELGYDDLNALVADGRAHVAIQPSLQASAGAPSRESDEYRTEIAQRDIVRGELLRLLEDHDLDALAYPTIRRIAALHGEEQGGTNCQLAANSGLPAITVPAGFHQGVPVGLELLGRAFDEQRLLNLAYTVEALAPQRRAPDLVSSDG